VLTHPTVDQTASAELVGDLFYEIHPQLWGKGIMSEAFAEVVRFAMEDMGCLTVTVSCALSSP
jgi:RimJ/RimL family protein N-acetyltransferase